APFMEPATISLIQTKSITIKPLDLLFRHDKRERNNTTTGFFDINPIPDTNANELPPIATSTFTTRTPENMPHAHRASTSANPDPMISPDFVEANYEVLESLLRERRKQIRNEDLRTELEYFSEKYDEEREMEPRPTRTKETTLVLCAGSPRVRIQRERVVEFKDAPKKDRSRVEMNFKGGRPSEQRVKASRNQGMNLHLLLTTHLGGNENGQHLKLQPSTGLIPTYVNLYSQPNMGISYGQPLSYHSHAQGVDYDPTMLPQNIRIPFTHRLSITTNTPDIPKLSPTAVQRIFWLCDPFVCWIWRTIPLPGGLKLPFSMHSYGRKGDPTIIAPVRGAIPFLNYEDLKAKFRSHFSQQKKFTKTHLAMHNIKKREGESTRAFVTRYTNDTLQILGLHKEQCISRFVHELKIRSLVEFLSTNLPTNYKVLMKKNYTWIKAKEVATNGAPNDHRESIDKFKKNSSWDNHKRKKNKDRFSPYRGSNHGLLFNLSKSTREILATKKVAKAFE
ncbi:hypothetical protein Tco_1088346, partial [Tanacetum coccineum]